NDGKKVLAGAYQKRVFTSDDYGQTWTERKPAGNQNKNWATGAVSANGMTMLVGDSSGRLYRSLNGGVNWQETQAAGNYDMNWMSSDISSDGTKMVAATYNNGAIYYSADSGQTWTNISHYYFGSNFWNIVAINDDGSRIIAGVQNGQLYAFDYTGTTGYPGPFNLTTIEVFGPFNRLWRSISMSPDGKKILAASGDLDDGTLFYSTNSGDDWVKLWPVLGKYWNTVSMSNDGTKMLAAEFSGKLYYSTNSGNNWVEMRPEGLNLSTWFAVNVSGDGNKLMSSTYGTIPKGRMYRYINAQNGSSSSVIKQKSDPVYKKALPLDGKNIKKSSFMKVFEYVKASVFDNEKEVNKDKIGMVSHLINWWKNLNIF
nr:hypothetical protein [Candidatus Gracilibacteria bacterium]